MKAKILRTDPHLGITKGEIYEAQLYQYDPEKVTLLARITDGYNPECNQYINEIEIVD